MKLTLDDFLHLTKVLRMLYGVQLATYFFETNFEEFTGIKLDRLHHLLSHDKLSTTQDLKSQGA